MFDPKRSLTSQPAAGAEAGDEVDEDQAIKDLIEQVYKPRVLGLIESTNDGEYLEDFEETINSEELINFVKVVMDLTLHMVLNDPPIKLELVPLETRKAKANVLEKFEFWMYSKQDYYCIDGFPTEGMPGVVVLPPPYRAGYVYQGLKPAVIVLNDDNLEDEALF